MKLFALNGDMGTQRLGRALGRPLAQGGDDGLVLGHGLRHAPAHAKLHPAKRLEPPVQTQRLLFEKGIARLAIDPVVESLVLAVIGVGIARFDRRRAERVSGVKIGQGRFGDAPCGKASAYAFDLGHGLEHFQKFDRPGLADEHAPARDLLGQPRCHQPPERLADRCARNVELCREPGFVETIAIVESAGEDHLFQRIGDGIGATFRHGKTLMPNLLVRKIENLVYKILDSGCALPNTPHTAPDRREPGQTWEDNMKFTAFAAAAASALVLGATAESAELRLSHQWSNQDIRHRVAQIVADEVAAAGVDLDIRIFGSQSLFKAREQYTPLSRGQLDMTVLPLSYAGGQQPSYNLTLMPGLVKNHDHAARLTNSPFMEALEAKMAEDDVMVLVHGYLAGGFAAKDRCIRRPEDIAGMQTRAAGKAFEQMLAGAGASIASMASSEIYNAMQTGVLDAVNTSSSSFVSFRIYEQVKCYTPAGDIALWFMYQPLLMNKSTFDGLTEAQQAALLAAAAKAEAFYLEEAKKEDAASVDVYREAGVEIAEMTEEDFAAWLDLARETAFKEFVASVPDGQALLDMALAVE